jgi:hypothetical protein
VKPCLSDDSLNRLLAGIATPAERAHLAVCLACAARFRRATGELAAIRQMLASTPEPVGHVARRRPTWWRPATAVAGAVMVAALVWAEVALWRGLVPSFAPSPVEEAQSDQLALALENLSATLFSMTGEPAAAFAETAALTPESDALDFDCDTADALISPECADPLEAGAARGWAIDQDPAEDDTDLE